jgi:cell division initiation protein
MRITPLDVRKQDFRKAVRGFDCDEVRAFLSTLADEYETVLVDNKQIRELIMEQEDKIQEYQGMERNLRDTLMTAERVMKETRNNASKKGELIVKDAEMQAQRVLEECRLRTEELRREIVVLRKEKESYLSRFKNLAQAQIQFVETHESDFEDLDNRLTNIVDSVVSTAGRTRRSTDNPQDISPAATPKAAPVATIDPFAAENRVEGDPSAPHDLPSNEDPDAVNSEETLEVAAPAAPMDTDVWRDYDPGNEKKGDEDTNGSIADLVSESLSESDEGPSIADGPVLTQVEEPVTVGPDKDSI